MVERGDTEGVKIRGVDFGISPTRYSRMLSESLRVSKLSLGFELCRTFLDILREIRIVYVPGLQILYVQFGTIAILDLKVNSL